MDKSEKAVSVFDKRAQDYQSRFMDVSHYGDTLDRFSAKLQPNATILELACGPGNVTRYLLDKRPDLKITGTDLSPNMLALARKNNPEAHFRLLDIRAIGKMEQSFDGVVCGFGLPYLSKTEAFDFIGKLSKILNPKGMVYLSTMEGDYQTSALQKSSDGQDEIFIHYHQTDYLVDALERAGMQIFTKKTQIYEPKPDTTDLILIAQWNPNSK